MATTGTINSQHPNAERTGNETNKQPRKKVAIEDKCVIVPPPRMEFNAEDARNNYEKVKQRKKDLTLEYIINKFMSYRETKHVIKYGWIDDYTFKELERLGFKVSRRKVLFLLKYTKVYW